MGISTPSMSTGSTSHQAGSTWFAGSPGRAFSQEHDIGHDPGALLLEGVRRQANGSEEISSVGQVLAVRGVLLIEREVAGDKSQDSAGLQSIERLGNRRNRGAGASGRGR